MTYEIGINNEKILIKGDNISLYDRSVYVHTNDSYVGFFFDVDYWRVLDENDR